MSIDSKEYEEFHFKVVNEGVRVSGEVHRKYWEETDFTDYFTDGYTPEETVESDISYWEP